MAKSTYYAVIKSINKGDKYSKLKEAIKRICIDNKGIYGYRRVTLELRRKGFKVNHKVAMKLMKQTGLTCKVRLKKYKSYRGEHGKAAPNILQRKFKADKLNEKW
jgi:putative transposase